MSHGSVYYYNNRKTLHGLFLLNSRDDARLSA